MHKLVRMLFFLCLAQVCLLVYCLFLLLQAQLSIKRVCQHTHSEAWRFKFPPYPQRPFLFPLTFEFDNHFDNDCYLHEAGLIGYRKGPSFFQLIHMSSMWWCVSSIIKEAVLCADICVLSFLCELYCYLVRLSCCPFPSPH